MRYVDGPRSRGQKWATFLRNHAGEIWACDCLQATSLLFRSLFAFFIIELKSRKVIHVGVARFPTDAWTAEPLREATPYEHMPKYLIRDHESKFGPCFARVAATSGIKILKTPYYAKRPNAICERFLLSVRRACLDHVLILQEKRLHRVLRAYVEYFNRARPHQGISSKFRKGKFPVCHQISVVIESSRFSFWVGYIMHTEEWLESYNIIGEIPERVRSE